MRDNKYKLLVLFLVTLGLIVLVFQFKRLFVSAETVSDNDVYTVSGTDFEYPLMFTLDNSVALSNDDIIIDLLDKNLKKINYSLTGQIDLPFPDNNTFCNILEINGTTFLVTYNSDVNMFSYVSFVSWRDQIDLIFKDAIDNPLAYYFSNGQWIPTPIVRNSTSLNYFLTNFQIDSTPTLGTNLSYQSSLYNYSISNLNDKNTVIYYFALITPFVCCGVTVYLIFCFWKIGKYFSKKLRGDI